MRDNNWIETQFEAMQKRLTAELEAWPGDEHRSTRRQIHLDLAAVKSAIAYLDEIRDLRW